MTRITLLSLSAVNPPLPYRSYPQRVSGLDIPARVSMAQVSIYGISPDAL